MSPVTSGPAATPAIVSGRDGAGRVAVVGTTDSLVIPGVTLPEFVLGHADQHGDKRALVDGTTSRTLTYRELAIDVRRVSAGLAAHGVQRQPVVQRDAGVCARPKPDALRRACCRGDAGEARGE